ncbi:metallophosphoesterase family protein [Algibacter sp. L4_22]|uniref:metallophosphoesterase family protein n=1 Tax=Algibacter sp. L4_22 TaxID=2942477 RepID=UPI00201B7E27|nr:metallophosphoesterase family protein [Algibacter sp. L4_22]MCL5128981.1 serine/threonine protein phosphatase [Algibacter sp. L4_22]
MRTIVIGDIHGGLKALVQLLNKLEVKDDDNLIFMGDYVDGWSESAQVVQLLMDLSKKINCVFIRGNHDVWCEEWLKTGEVNQTWYVHGGKETMASYNGFTKEEKEEQIAFFENLKFYYLDNQNRLFLHAGFTSMHGVEKEVHKPTLYFDRTLWEMALAIDNNLKIDSYFYPNRLKHYHEIYIGHTPTTNFKCDIPMNAVNIWNVDTGAAFKGRISGMDIETKTFLQSDPVYTLYPNEKGRNKD